MSMETLYLAAWIDGLQRVNEPAQPPPAPLARYTRLDVRARSPYVPLWGAQPEGRQR